MRRYIICFIIICLSLWSSFASAQVKEKEKAALEAAENWLSVIDSGNYAQSWQMASGYFKNFVTENQWQQSLSAARQPLGKVISREAEIKQYKTSLPGAPDGEYVVIKFLASFANKKLALETVILTIEKDGYWRVSGYYIKQMPQLFYC
jgi:hypothetical protein